MKKLLEIATITTGVYQKMNPSGDTIYLQAKHFDEQGVLHEEESILPEVQMNHRLHRHLLEDGDVLLMAKGERNKACIYKSEYGTAVASSAFFVIRLIKKTVVVPEYLQWYLNTVRTQLMFSKLSKGTHILNLSKKNLSNVKISIPSMQKQREILEVQKTWEQEQKITFELLKLKDTLYQNVLLNLAKSEI